MQTYLQMVQTGFAPAEVVLEQPPSGDTAECVKFDLGMAAKHYAYTAAYLCRAGWTLARQKAAMVHGEWQKWCRESFNMSEDTAARYIKTAHIVIGRWRESQGLANTMVAELTDKMIAAATAGMEYKTATQMMVDLGVVSRPEGWGGKREGAGRKAAGALPKLTARQEAETLWAQVMGVLDKTTVKDAIRYLGEGAAEACLGRVAELAEALKLQVRELKGVRR